MTTYFQPDSRPIPRSRILAVAVVAHALALTAVMGSAAARSERTTYHGYDQVWSSSVRFLRVDEGFEILEKDADAGYVLFAVKQDNKQFRGALELVRIKDERGRPAIRLVLRIEDRPTYVEIGVLERLERKLREEYGEPPPPKPEKAGGADKNAK